MKDELIDMAVVEQRIYAEWRIWWHEQGAPEEVAGGVDARRFDALEAEFRAYQASHP